MEVDDQLKTTVRHHLANWKTLRGKTPFYSEMFWPPVVDDSPNPPPRVSGFTEFPSFQIYVEEIFTSEQVLRAQDEYPQFSVVMSPMLGIESRAGVRGRRPEHAEMRAPTVSDGKMTFDLVKKAFLVEAETRKSSSQSWQPLEILKFALKAADFSQLFGAVEVITAEGDIFYYSSAKRASNGLAGASLFRAAGPVVSRVLAKHAIPQGCLKNPHDLSAFAADIASQGYDAVLVSPDGAENGFVATGLRSIKSIRAMDKHLGGNLSVKALDLAKNRKRLPGNRVIRPLLKAVYGIRVFVTGGEVIAATAQSKTAIPGNQTAPFIEEVGCNLSDFATGPYRTQFNESLVDRQVFERLIHKARFVAEDLKRAGELHYAMDVLTHEDGSFAIDLHDLVSADYFSLAPSVVAAAIQKKVIEDMAVGLAAAEQFSGKELAKLAASMSRHLKYTLKTQETDESENDFYQLESLSDRPRGRFSEIVESTARIRGLLSVHDKAQQLQPDTDSSFLADLLAITADHRTDFDLDAFIDALRQDFIARGPSEIQKLWDAKKLLCLVPLLDAALWFKNGDRQTWRYCATNQFVTAVTVRKIDSAPSLSEQEFGFGPGPCRRRIVDNGFDFDPVDEFGPTEKAEGDENLLGSLEFEMPPENAEPEEDEPDSTEKGTTIDFLSQLLEDED